MSLGNSYPQRGSIPNTVTIRGVWTGGGVATSLSRLPADWSRGIKSIVWTATGKYTITFVDSGQQVVGHSNDVCSAAGSVKKLVNCLRSTYSASLKTLQIEVQQAGVLTDLAVTDQLLVKVVLVTGKPT